MSSESSFSINRSVRGAQGAGEEGAPTSRQPLQEESQSVQVPNVYGLLSQIPLRVWYLGPEPWVLGPSEFGMRTYALLDIPWLYAIRKIGLTGSEMGLATPEFVVCGRRFIFEGAGQSRHSSADSTYRIPATIKAATKSGDCWDDVELPRIREPKSGSPNLDSKYSRALIIRTLTSRVPSL